MLNLYLGDISKDIITSNDGWFDSNFDKIDFTDNTVRHILEVIDGAKYVGNNEVTTKFSRDARVKITELSTGCKTAVNVYTFRDKIFTAIECGENALNEIFKLTDGSINISFPIWPSVLNNSINVICDSNNYTISEQRKLRSLIVNYFNELRSN